MSITASEDILIVNETLTIDGTTSSTTTASGALIVSGGVGIGGDVNIGGDVLVKGTTTIENTLTIGLGGSSYTFPAERGTSGQLLLFSTSSGGLEFTDLTLLNAPSAFGTDNRLIKSSGTGTDVEITGISLSDGNDLSGINTLDVNTTATIGGTLTVNSVQSSSNNTTGAIVVDGGVGIAENLNIGGDVCVDGNLKVATELTLGSGLTSYAFPTETGVAGEILSVSTAGTLVFSANGASPFAVCAPEVFGTDNRLVRTIGTGRTIEATDVILKDTNDMSGLNTMSVDNEVTIGGVLTLSSAEPSASNGTGALVVTGGVGIGENLNVAGDTTTDGSVSVNDITESTSTDSGALTVDGGVGIGGNLNVGGTLTADTIAIGVGDLIVSSTTASTSNTSGALVVSGGVGISGNTNIGGDTNIDGLLTVQGVSSIDNTTSSTDNTTGALIIAGGLGLGENLNMGGVLNVNNATSSTDQNSGAVVVDGGVGIAENLNIGGELNTDGVMNVNNPTNATSTTGPAALVVSGGVSIAKDLYVGGSLVLDEPLVSNSQFFMASHTTPVTVSTTTFSPLQWDTEIRKDTGLYSHSASSTDVTVLESGWYKIVANIASEITIGNGTIRTISSSRVTINSVPVTGSTSFMYNRTAERGQGTCTIVILQNLTANDIINIEINRLLGTSTVTTIANACRLFVSRV